MLDRASCLRDKAIISLFFSKLSDFYFDLRPPRANPRQTHGQDKSENPTPGATRMCESAVVARGGEGGGQAWN